MWWKYIEMSRVQSSLRRPGGRRDKAVVVDRQGLGGPFAHAAGYHAAFRITDATPKYTMSATSRAEVVAGLRNRSSSSARARKRKGPAGYAR